MLIDEVVDGDVVPLADFDSVPLDVIEKDVDHDIDGELLSLDDSL